jgi:uncharacterized RDD family membrane protein YckC
MAKYGDVREAIAQAEMEAARELLRAYLETEPDSAEAWYLASKAAINDKQKRYFLEKAVECDPLHAAAGLELYALINGKEQPSSLPVTETQPQVAPKPVTIPAPILSRVFAFALDVALLFFMSLFLSRVAMLFTGGAVDQQAILRHFILWTVFNALFYIGYFGYSFTRSQGQTFGKRMMGIRVIKRNGEKLNWADAFLRCWVGYLLSAAPLGLGFLWALIDKQKRAWHDIIADTLVVKA